MVQERTKEKHDTQSILLTVTFNLVRRLARVSSKKQEQTLITVKKHSQCSTSARLYQVTLTWHFRVVNGTIFLHCYKAYSGTRALLHSYMALVCQDVIHSMNLSYKP